uniref:Uncharacterized protein n=1 Tax=Anguilla anguilla TaxID=7936 RepID=A0A0E9STN2_ANGAN
MTNTFNIRSMQEISVDSMPSTLIQCHIGRVVLPCMYGPD